MTFKDCSISRLFTCIEGKTYRVISEKHVIWYPQVAYFYTSSGSL